MGSKKKKTKVEPWAPAQPHIIKGMEQTSAVFDENQPRLRAMSDQAYDAFGRMAPNAFGTSPYVANAQGAARTISNGYFLGTNPGQPAYDRLQAGAGDDPSAGVLGRLARAGGGNPADAYASAVAGGQHLNAQPSAGLYSSVMADDYLHGNPYLDGMIARTNADVARQANRMFGARGMGAGVSSAFADVLSRNLADNEGQLRYQNYNDAAGRQLLAAGQSDAAWSGERDRMDAATGLLAGNHDRAQDRALAAAQALAAQQGAGQDRALEAARASDAARSDQIAQMLQALGLTGGLRDAEFAGVAPALSLMNAAADLPYVGVAALNGNIRDASNGYSTTTQKTSGGLGGLLGDVAGAAAGSFGQALGGGLYGSLFRKPAGG